MLPCTPNELRSLFSEHIGVQMHQTQTQKEEQIICILIITTMAEQKYCRQLDRSKTHQRTKLKEMHINGVLKVNLNMHL